MAMTLLEKILAAHSKYESVKPGEIIDIEIDTRVARDFGGPNVVKNIRDFGLSIENNKKTLFTFDCNPTGSDQKYAANQHICRQFARENDIRVFDIDSGIGTHLLIEKGYVYPGSTAVSTDSHANILGAVGAFGQGMGDLDIAAAWNKGRVWFKIPPSAKILFEGKIPDNVSSKDIVLNMLNIFGANTLLGYSVELYGPSVDDMTLDDRITISSMATEMGAVIILFPPSVDIIDYCIEKSQKKFNAVFADKEAVYDKLYSIDVTEFRPMVSRPGEPHDTVNVSEVQGIKIDSAFIGSCTNGRMDDMQEVARILKNRKVAPGVVLKIVPATDDIWKECLELGLIAIFKKAGALVSNSGCAGCAAGQVGQNGPGEIALSTGNRNFPGKQGKGSVYLASPAIVAASSVAGYITNPDEIPEIPSVFLKSEKSKQPSFKNITKMSESPKASVLEGRIWLVPYDNIDTDMIFHNRYLAITDKNDMAQHSFENLNGFEDFSKKAKPGDLIITGKNFGCGSSRQHAVDCLSALGIQAVIAESFGVIYERNAINAAFPIVLCKNILKMDIKNGDRIKVNLITGEIENNRNKLVFNALPFSDVQFEIYTQGGLLGRSPDSF